MAELTFETIELSELYTRDEFDIEPLLLIGRRDALLRAGPAVFGARPFAREGDSLAIWHDLVHSVDAGDDGAYRTTLVAFPSSRARQYLEGTSGTVQSREV